MANNSPIYFWKEDDPELGFLCQWYPSPFECIVVEGGEKVKFRNAEQYMMHGKAIHFKDYATAREILSTSSFRKCKALSHRTKGFTDVEWDKVKSRVVEEGSYYKFTLSDGKGGEDLKKKLLDTGNRELVEASRFDRVWGVGFDATTLKMGKKGGAGRENWGENRLGKALMVARERIRKEEEEKNAGGAGEV